MVYENVISDLRDKADRGFFELEVTTKNITNISTPGYKIERTLPFDETLKETQRYMEAGKLQITKRESDVSLDGKGFFLLKDKEGKEILTRNLDLHRDKNRNLVSGINDYEVCPKSQMAETFIGFQVNIDGLLLGKREDSTLVPIKKLSIVNFPDSEKLDFDGEVYRPTREAGMALPVCAGKIGQTMVRQGTQESSNVDAPLEFNKFKEINLKLSTLSKLNQLLNSSERQYINSLTGLL